MESIPMETDDEEEQDSHICAKCKIVFKKLDDYIQHKLSKDNCRVKYTKSKRVLIPHLVSRNETNNTKTGGVSKRGRPPKKKGVKHKRIESDHSKEDIIQDKFSYKCHACPKTFSREAALKRHIEYDHTKQMLDSDEDVEDEDTAGEGDDENYTAGTEEEFTPPRQKSATRSPRLAKTIIQDTDLPEGVVLKINIEKREPGEIQADSDKPYACAACGRCFKDMNILKAHFLTHSDRRDFICQWEGCTYAFKTKGSLKRHMRRHTGERPYVCPKCNRAFGESGALTRHSKSRVPCTQKADDDFPRYGKKMSLDMKIPAATAQLKDNEGEDASTALENVIVSQSPGKNVRFVITQPGNTGQQVATAGEVILADGTKVPSVTLVPVKQDAKASESPSVVIDASDIDGHAGEEEVVAETIDVREDAGISEVEDENDPVLSEVDETIIPESLTCRACNVTFEDLSSLKAHLKTHLTDSPFRCGLCTYATPNKDSLNAHMQIVHQSSLKSLKSEGTENEQPVVFAPDTQEVILTQTPDGITIQTNPEVQDQIIQAENSAPEKSPEELEKQTAEASLALQQLLELRDSSDVKTVVPNGSHGYKTLYKCPVCERSFRGNAYLRLHMRTHTGEKPHKCPHCPKFFSTRDTLSKHLTVHSDERNYKCGECGKMFKRISHVREHLKVHSNDRPFACTICCKPFKTANACKVHMRTHSDALPYDCQFCHKNFREKGSLERHLRTHTGEKPYKCKHCDRAFAEHGTLNRHLKAKVPCTKGLHLARTVPMQGESLTEEEMQQQEIPDALDESELELETVPAEISSGEKFPTVLAEFSSVVADTQQYIIQSQGEQSGTEYVMVGPDGEAETVQNVEVITNLQEGAPEGMQDVQYIMVNQDNEFIIVNEQNDGHLSLVPPDGTVALPQGDVVITDEAVTDLALVQKEGEAVELTQEGTGDGDTIYKAMMVANVVEEMETETITDQAPETE